MLRICICIGVSSYECERLDPLLGAKQDAVDIFDKLTDSRIGDYDPDKSTLLLNPTRQEFYDNLDKALFSSNVDTFTIFYAGHTGVKDGAYYLTTKDTKIDRLSITGIAIHSLFSIIGEAKPRQTNIVIDGCQAAGFVGDLGALLKPEVIGQANTPSVSLLALSAADQSSRETDEGGIGTRAVLRCLSGDVPIRSSFPVLSLADICTVVGDALALEGLQQPTFWSFNLYGESQFCKNPSYKGTVQEFPFTPSPEQFPAVDEIGDFQEELWRAYLDLPDHFSPRFIYDTVSNRINTLSDESVEAFMIQGLFETFAQRAEGGEDCFQKSIVMASFACTLLSKIDKSQIYDSLFDRFLSELFDSLTTAFREIEESLSSDKYALMSTAGGYADMYIIPIRLSKITGWMGCHALIGNYLDRSDELPRESWLSIMEQINSTYLTTIAAVSEAQAPYLACLIELVDMDELSEQIFTFVSSLYADFLRYAEFVAESGLSGEQILEFLVRRHRRERGDRGDLFGGPSELLPALLLYYIAQNEIDIIRYDLKELDHLEINFFVPNTYRDFGKERIYGGSNLLGRIGYGIWTIEDVRRFWLNQVSPEIKESLSSGEGRVQIAAVIASFLYPDRVPWFVLMNSIADE